MLTYKESLEVKRIAGNMLQGAATEADRLRHELLCTTAIKIGRKVAKAKWLLQQDCGGQCH